MAGPKNLRVAVLVNHPPHTTFWPEVKQAFVDGLAIVAPHATISFYDPVDKGEYPNPSQYDLVILSGGKADASASDPWILRMIEFVQDTVKSYPETKLLGICWGHQLISRALGGSVRAVPTGPIAGLVRVDLTEKGRELFPSLAQKGFYLASQFHVREVEVPAPTFVELGENHEAYLSESNTILTFQAHPEIDGVFSSKILADDDLTYVERLSPAEVEGLKKHCTDDQDGIAILERIVAWVNE